VGQWSIGIDTGGTFTDLSAVDSASGETYVAKVPSTPSGPADAIFNALDRFSRDKGVSLGELSLLAHGTTVATNALLEEKGAQAGLLITKGFRAVYMARAGTRPIGSDLIDPAYRKSPPLIPLSLTCEIPERVGFDGKVTLPLDREAVRAAAERLSSKGCRSVAICFLFSFLHDGHEREAAEIIRETCPDMRVSISSEVLPVIREFPRMSTVVLDAYVGPIVSAYFGEVGRRAQTHGVDLSRLFIMQSNGGLMRLNIASAFPNETLLSGPAAGISFASTLARACGYDDMVTFDMGGTSTDTCLIRGGRATLVNNGIVAGQELGTSMIEIRTIGAGGGAIAHVGEDGLLNVGPQSAGARPGPACYARGGTEPTVTDANVMLGYIDPERFLGGELKGDRKLAQAALAKLAKELGVDELQAAIGVRRVVNSRMGSALRLNITERGCDPRAFSLLAFGGGGPLHAVEIAADLGLRRVIVPAHPGVSCAMGLLLSDVRHEYLRSMPQNFQAASAESLSAAFEALESKAREDAVREGFAVEEAVLTRQLDVRYIHQGYQLTIDVPTPFRDSDIQAARRSFDETHESIYGTSAPDEEAEIVTARVVSVVRLPSIPLSSVTAESDPSDAQPVTSRHAFFQKIRDFMPTPVYTRDALKPGFRVDGPLIIEQLDSTTVVDVGHTLEVDEIGNLVIETGGEVHSQ